MTRTWSLVIKGSWSIVMKRAWIIVMRKAWRLVMTGFKEHTDNKGEGAF